MGRFSWLLVLALAVCAPLISTAETGLPRLRVGPEGRFLIEETGKPFVWIGETNWFFAKVDPEKRDRLLDRRSGQGFTVLFIAAREALYDGRGGPYLEGDVTRFNEPWWEYLEEYVDEAGRRGMYVGVALGWWGHVARNGPEKLYRNGLRAARRLNGKTNVVWLVAGEAGGHERKTVLPRENVEAIVRGIRDGDEDDKLLTVHADFRRGTSLNRDAELVDFNNWQTSQWCCRDDLPRKDPRRWTVWEAIGYDYEQDYPTPSGRKPTLDAEAFYERNKDFCGGTPLMVRRRAYFTILAGAFGHSYGAGGAWDGLTEPEGCSGDVVQALEYEGADDVGHVATLLRSLGDGLLEMRPRQEMVLSGQSRSYDSHIQAAAARDGRFALVYDADGGTVRLDLTTLVDGALQARWFDPREGEFGDPFAVERGDDVRLTAPTSGQDWVLVVEALR